MSELTDGSTETHYDLVLLVCLDGGHLAEFRTPRVDPDLVDELAEYDVRFRGVVENTFFRSRSEPFAE